jgi:hypothetical protein
MAFQSFDWEGDEKWLAYRRNIELPGLDPVGALERAKARWYKKNIVSES